MQRKKLPLARTVFSDIRNPENNFVYIDKTEEVHKLIEGAKYYFLSRPRRFGKSLFLDTLSELFKGNKPLFEGLYIHDKYDWDQRFPVIKIDFAGGSLSSMPMIMEKLNDCILKNVTELGLDFEAIDSPNPGVLLERLIYAAYKKHGQQVVVLIDEYDKPIIDNISNHKKEVALEARELLRGFYSALKASDRYLRFMFMTGVSKFAKLNLFSGLNNLVDITIDPEFATITGYTQHDLETSFADYMQGIDVDAVKRWYNGYNYFGDPIYNPYDILQFFSMKGEFRNYWWQTGNPQFLIDKLTEGNYFLPRLETITVTEETLNAFDVDTIDLVALLWQTGYLTFDKKIQSLMGHISYTMKVPNIEVQSSLNQLFYRSLAVAKQDPAQKQITVIDLLLHRNFELVQQELQSLFAAIPYHNYTGNNIAAYEGYYASVLYAFLCSLGFEVITEDATNLGRVDLTLIGPNDIFILEFKVDMPAEAALHQIETKKYYEKYLNQNKAIHLIGIHFSSEERNVVGMEWREQK